MQTVAEVVVEFGQGFRQVGLSAPINNIEPFVGMSVIETKAVFARGTKVSDLSVCPSGATSNKTMGHKMVLRDSRCHLRHRSIYRNFERRDQSQALGKVRKV